VAELLGTIGEELEPDFVDEESAEPGAETAQPGDSEEEGDASGDSPEPTEPAELTVEAKEAAQQAYLVGLEDGRQEMAEQLAELQARMDTVGPLLDRLEGLRSQIVRESSEEVANLVLYIARRVVGETLAVHPPALRKLVTDALSRLPGDDEVRIRVRPEDLPVIEGTLGTRRQITLEADPNLEGGVVVEASCGEVEASLEAAFEGLRQAVTEWLEDQE
jgi:flagellar assembly protein FliH